MVNILTKKQKEKKIKEILKNKTVGIAGAGGLGSNAAVSLARIGIGKIIIVDFDKIEKSNLNRQYYFTDQIGKIKVEALKENINKINPKTKIDAITKKLVKGEMTKYFQKADIIIEAFDKADSKTVFIEEVLKKLPEKPIIAASGVAGYGNSDEITTKKLGNLYLCYHENALSSDEDVLMAPKVCLMANWQANIALEILLGEIK